MSSRQFIFKILLTGDGAVGKTSIRERYMGKGFSGGYLKTIGADFASKKIEIEPHKVTYQIFDLAGQDAYVTARSSFYKGGQAAFLVFDLQDPDTLLNLKTWIQDCITNSDGYIQTFVILGNKADLVQTRQVSPEMITDFVNQMVAQTGLSFYYLDTSAKSGLNIAESFDLIGRSLLKKHNIDVDLVIPETAVVYAPGKQRSPIDQRVDVAVNELVSKSDVIINELQNEAEDLNSQISQIKEQSLNHESRIISLEKKVDKLIEILESIVDAETVEN